MSHESPLKSRHAVAAAAFARELAERGGAEAADGVALQFITCGPDDEHPLYEVVGTYGQVQLEYAAVRKGAAIFDDAGRGTLQFTGGERIDFLNRMVTQELKGLDIGGVRDAFWLDRKGRIIADLAIAETGDHALASVERQSAPAAASSFDEFLFGDDVTIAEASNEWHHIGVHGPRTLELLSSAAGEVLQLHEEDVARVAIGAAECVIVPRNLTGGPGVDVICSRENVGDVWDQLLGNGRALGDRPGRVRSVGWYALNCVRIEAGVPLFNVDFSNANLPAESGLLDERVSFTKGCYPGQEVVSRMYHLGKPKQAVMGFEMASDAMPVAGAAVHKATDDGTAATERVIGAVTSSTPSPLRSLSAIGLAMVKGREASPGAPVFIVADGDRAPARICALTELPAALKKAATP